MAPNDYVRELKNCRDCRNIDCTCPKTIGRAVENEKFSNFRGVEIIEVLKISVNEGLGKTDDPIYREVYYCLKDGTIIGKQTSYEPRKYAGG